MRKRRLKRRLNKKGKILLLAITLIIFICILMIFKKNDSIFNQMINNNKYSLKTYYEKTEIKNLDKLIKEKIIKEKKEFIELAKQNDSDNKFDFIFDAQTQKYNDCYFIHSVIQKYVGGAHYERIDKSYIYSKKYKKYLTINDFVEGKENMQKLSLMIKHKIYGISYDKEIELTKEEIENSTTPNLDNYEHFYFNDEGITIIFVPMKIFGWSEGETKVTISWENINDLLKEEYKNKNYISNNKTNIIPKARDINMLKGKKVIAFTFDDGPNAATTSILLDGLKKLDAKATFFVLGSRISYNVKTLQRAYEEGNEIGSHTYSHKNLLNLSTEELKYEIENTNKTIKDTIGIVPNLIRPPYGNINAKVKQATMMHTICWNIDSNDWRTGNRNKIKDEIVNHAYDGAIVLLHDIYEESVYGALLAIKELKNRGYEFVTISEMSELKGTMLDYDTTYFGF